MPQAEWMGCCAVSRPSFATIVAPATPVRLSGNPAPAVARCNFPGVIPQSPAGDGAWPFGSSEAAKTNKGVHTKARRCFAKPQAYCPSSLLIAQRIQTKWLRRKHDIFVSSCKTLLPYLRILAGRQSQNLTLASTNTCRPRFWLRMMSSPTGTPNPLAGARNGRSPEVLV